MKGYQDLKEKGCKLCGMHAGLVSKYHLFICRRCFKDLAERLGFKKYM